MQIQKKIIHEDPDGEKWMNFDGKTPVFSGCSGGTTPRTTRGRIYLDTNQMVRVSTRGKSRVPAYSDVRKALTEFFLALEVKIPEERPEDLKRETTGAGAKYVGLGNWWIGRSDKDKFSMRGKDAIPFDVLLKLLVPLDEYLEGR